MKIITSLLFKTISRSFLICSAIFSISYCGNDKETKTQNSSVEKKSEKITQKIIEVEEHKTFYYITAINGLSLRKEPSLESEKIDVISFGKNIQTLKKTVKTSLIDSDNYKIENYWYLINYNNKKGWVFGEYLSMNKMTKQLVMLDRLIKRPFINYPPIRMIQPNSNLYDAIITTFGKPKNIKKQDVKNRYDPKQIDQTINIVYNFARFNFYKYKDKYMLTSFSIYTEKYKLQNNLKFSMKISDIKKLFGKPTTIRDSQYYYSVPDGPVENDVIFKFNDGVLNEITILYYFD